MRYETFVEKTKQFPVFGNEVMSLFPGVKGGLSLQLHRWVQSGKVIRLKRGLYALPEERRLTRFSLSWLANTLYSPSYVSLEFALSWYDLIPERVPAITSVTRLKTKTFQNPLGHFTYQHVQPNLFFGFETRVDENKTRILMATPEKALLDWLYLKKYWEPDPDDFEKNLRLQQLDQLKRERLKLYIKKYTSQKMKRAGEVLLEMMK